MSDEHSQPPLGPLARVNAQVHGAHEETLLSLVELLTQLDVEGARRALGSLSQEMTAHLAVEDASTHLRYAELADHVRGAAPELFEADHVSHRKVMATCDEALEQLDEQAPGLRRRIVLILPLFYRLRNVLEHHTSREQRFLYPRLDAELPVDEREALVRALTAPRES